MDIPKFSYLPKGTSVSYLEVSRKDNFRTETVHMHDHDEIVLATGCGSCEVTNNGNVLTVKTPAIFINRVGTFHETTKTQGEYHSRVVFFHPQIFDRFPKEMRPEPRLFAGDLLYLPLTAAQVSMFTPLFDLLKERPLEQKTLMLLAILYQMAQLMDEGVQSVITKADQSYIFRVVAAVREMACEKFSAAALADRFHVSYTKLKTDFRHVTGTSIKAYTNQVRLQKALTLLEASPMDQAGIAYACGFADESYFIQLFRTTYGMTPGTYRKLHTKKPGIR